jgi:hypothetical protein
MAVGRRFCALSGDHQTFGQPMHSVHSGSLALSGTQTYSSKVQGGLLLAKAAPEPNTYHRNLRSRGLHKLGPTGRNVQACISPRPLLGIPAECTGLIAKK